MLIWLLFVLFGCESKTLHDVLLVCTVERGNAVSKEDRKPLMQAFRNVLYATSEVAAETLYDDLLQLVEEYKGFQIYVGALWERRESWCMAWRNIASMRGHHTNNYAEVTVRLFKDNILTRCKAYNAVASSTSSCQ